MKVIVGSKNSTKIEAVKEALREFSQFSNAEVCGVQVDTGVHK